MTSSAYEGTRLFSEFWMQAAGGLLLVAVSVLLALLGPAYALSLCLFCVAALAAGRLDAQSRVPGLLGSTAALGLYFSTGIGSIDLPAVVPLSGVFILLATLRAGGGVIPRLPSDLRIALGVFLGALILGVVRGQAPKEGVRVLVILLWLLLTGWLSFVLCLERRESALFRSYSVVAAAYGLLNITFFVFPRAEDAYFASWISQVFVEPDSIRKLLTGDVVNNALSDLKAATIYVNANVAAMFFGTAAWVSYGWWQGSRWRWPLIGACVLGALGTVSRGGALAGAVSFILWGLLQLRGRAFWRIALRLTGGALAVGIIGLVLANVRSESFGRFAWSTVSADPRFVLWGAAIALIHSHPLVGSGFGAWEAYWPAIATVVNLRTSFPPHNVYLYLWIIGGLLAPVGFLGIAVALLRSVRHLTLGDGLRSNPEALAVAAIVGWCWVQANFENFFFLDYRIGFLLAATVGWVLARGAAAAAE